MKTYTTILFSIFMLFGFAGQVQAQFSIDDLNIAFSEDFDGFDGSGFDSSPTAGQLDSDSWRITGMSDGDGTFGGTHDGGDFARGSSAGSVTTGGTYSFDVNGDGSLIVLGAQPISSDFNPGEITLIIQNNTGAEITDLDISYNIYVYNDQERSSSFNFAHSSDDATYSDIGALDYATPQAADTPASWVQVNRSTTITGLSIGIGEFYYLQWKSADAAGSSGSRDQFGLTNLSITADGDEIQDPTISALPTTLEGFHYYLDEGPSDEQSFSVSGASLESDITITPPTNYEISTGSGGSFVSQDPIVLSETEGEVATTTIYVRLESGLGVGAYDSQDITLTSTNATTVNITLDGLASPKIILNEFLADPPADTDVNGDGNNSTSEDEFIEFVNAGGSDLDISNWTIDEGAGLAHTFPTSTILKPMQAIVIFSGGSAVGDFGGSLTQISTEGYALNNTGDDIILKNDSGLEIINYTYGSEANSDESVTRNTDLTGAFVQHETADTDDASSFSPGTRIDGSTFQPSVNITGNEGWRIISTPTDGNTYADLLDILWTQGIATGADVTNGAANVHSFNGTSFSPVNDLTTTMTAGEGFIVYVYDDDDYDGTPDGFPKTLELFSVPNSGSVSPTLTPGANEWTLIGNPYYSTIDWDLLDKTDLTGSVYVYDHSYGTPTGDDIEASGSAGSYRVWNGATGSLTDGLIAPFQGFWVQNAGSGTPALTIEEDDKASGGTFYKGSTKESITIKLHGKMENMYSEAYLSFTEHGVIEKDDFDALKLTPLDFRNYLSLATLTDGTKLDINNLPNDFEGEIEIPVSVQAFQANAETGTWIDKDGEVEFSWPEMKNVPEDWSLTLQDFETGETIDMRAIDSYVFTIEGSAKKTKNVPVTSIFNPQPPQTERMAKSVNDLRFTIKLSKGEVVSNESGNAPQKFTLDQNYPNPFNPTTNIEYSVSEPGNVNLTIYNVMGQRVATLVSETKSTGTYRVHWDASGMASGIYYYRLQSAGQVLTRQMTLIK